MSEIGQIGVIAAPACPGCRNRLTGLPLDELADGSAYQCPFCGEQMKIPQQVLGKLIAQRDELRAAQAQNEPSFLSKLFSTLKTLLGG